MSKITDSAKGEHCTIRIPSICNFEPDTTVFCHLNGAGLAIKHLDIFGAYGCSSCHDVVDFKVQTGFSRQMILLFFFEGVFKTQAILLKKGLLTYELK